MDLNTVQLIARFYRRGSSADVVTASHPATKEVLNQFPEASAQDTAEAMKNFDDIVSTPGLDGVYIGPPNLTFGLTGAEIPDRFDPKES